jgi:tRNA A37 N6-isopentenylltransferase MiaA
MDISRLNAVMETLRRQLSETERRSGPENSRTSTSSSRTPASSPQRSLAQLKQRVRDRLKNIDPSDPQRKSRSRRIFIESVLAWEFGEQLLSDRKLDEFVEQIQTAMSSQPDIDQQLSELLTPGSDDVR